jgi:hypothetical protein
MSIYLNRGLRAVACALVLGMPELFGVLGSGMALAESADDDWRWSITPYLWGSDMDADIRFPGGQEVGGEAGFDDILDKLDFAAQVHLEGQRGAWGMFVDATYLTMSDDTTHGSISADAEIDTGIYEFAALYTPGGESGQFSVIAGARIIDLGLDLTFQGPGPGGPIERSVDKSFTDFMVGGRFVHAFNDRWLLNLRGDVGAGDTDSSSNALAVVGWRFGGHLDKVVLFGWRHLELEVEDSGRETDITMDGPIVGVLFSF